MILQSLGNLKRTAKVSAKGVSLPSVDFGGNWSDDERKKFSFSREQDFLGTRNSRGSNILSNKQINSIYLYIFIYISFPIFTRKFILNENSY